jgi:hypothetical protein
VYEVQPGASEWRHGWHGREAERPASRPAGRHQAAQVLEHVFAPKNPHMPVPLTPTLPFHLPPPNHTPQLEGEAQAELLNTQAARCMGCGTPYCLNKTTGCPLGNREWGGLAKRVCVRACVCVCVCGQMRQSGKRGY